MPTQMAALISTIGTESFEPYVSVDKAAQYLDIKRKTLLVKARKGQVPAYVAARDPGILGVAMIAASNLGPSTMRALSRDPKELHERFRANASRLVGATAEGLLEEVKQNGENWDYLNYAPALKDRPVLILEVDDRNTPDNQALAAALKKIGNSRVTETHMATDHTLSDHRIAQQGVVVEWLHSVAAQRAKLGLAEN